ncbi:MAG TPA: hypothetical protein VMT66_01775 [Steroidobacteraceae bacterium]|nr:hypothetical protein [Steroidobacteraceae bacterium]
MSDAGKSDTATDEAGKREAGKREASERRQKIQRQLDEALEDSFPASDPVSIVTSHDEEDWGTDEKPSTPPQKPAPGSPR